MNNKEKCLKVEELLLKSGFKKVWFSDKSGFWFEFYETVDDLDIQYTFDIDTMSLYKNIKVYNEIMSNRQYEILWKKKINFKLFLFYEYKLYNCNSIVNNLKQNKMSTTRKTKAIKPLYSATNLKKTSAKNLWVTFVAGDERNAQVFTSTLTRDAVRNNARKYFGVNMSDVRARRVTSYRSLIA
jgi:hypothetical protein